MVAERWKPDGLFVQKTSLDDYIQKLDWKEIVNINGYGFFLLPID